MTDNNSLEICGVVPDIPCECGGRDQVHLLVLAFYTLDWDLTVNGKERKTKETYSIESNLHRPQFRMGRSPGWLHSSLQQEFSQMINIDVTRREQRVKLSLYGVISLALVGRGCEIVRRTFR